MDTWCYFSRRFTVLPKEFLKGARTHPQPIFKTQILIYSGRNPFGGVNLLGPKKFFFGGPEKLSSEGKSECSGVARYVPEAAKNQKTRAERRQPRMGVATRCVEGKNTTACSVHPCARHARAFLLSQGGKVGDRFLRPCSVFLPLPQRLCVLLKMQSSVRPNAPREQKAIRCFFFSGG